MRLQDNFEVELKLTVTGENPDALLDEVAQLTELGAIRLSPAEDHRLHDVYWDRPDRAMRQQQLSLRLRQIDERLVFTVKGGTSNSDGLFRRNELEVPATHENWLELRTVLSNEGVELGPDVATDEPEAWLRSAGLEPTQDRVTRRTVRYALSRETGGEPSAEIALDRTRFEIGATPVDYWEIEIEQLNGQEQAPRKLGKALLRRYPGRLEPST